MSYRDPHDEMLETLAGLTIAGLFFWVVFFLVRDLILATPL